MPAAKRFLRVTHLLFLATLGVQFLPDHAGITDPHTAWLIGFVLLLEVLTLALTPVFKKKESLNLFLDVIGFIFGFLLLWTLLTAKLSLLPTALFPPFGKVLSQFWEDAPKILVNIKSSVGIILQGFLLAIVTAIPIGLFLGWNARLGSAAMYLSKFFSSIPPIVYIPYGIALLPSFRSVSVFVIFLASFWPTFAGTMSGVLNVDQRILDSAKVLGVSRPTMLSRVILPASLPQIFLGCNQGLSVSFILLTSAEMIGARDGMGYYVKYYSDFGDYTRTIAGLLVIGIVVIGVTFLMGKLQGYLLRWKR
ncbi:MAG: ABC transporter permease subunit [Oscillospiraceae bacterium]|nr:ABC transporter permease subunit [Oscillospiraceae bacterium]